MRENLIRNAGEIKNFKHTQAKSFSTYTLSKLSMCK